MSNLPLVVDMENQVSKARPIGDLISNGYKLDPNISGNKDSQSAEDESTNLTGNLLPDAFECEYTRCRRDPLNNWRVDIDATFATKSTLTVPPRVWRHYAPTRRPLAEPPASTLTTLDQDGATKRMESRSRLTPLD